MSENSSNSNTIRAFRKKLEKMDAKPGSPAAGEAVSSIKKMRRYWISWIEQEKDYRPIVYPPNKNILGWWCSGYDSKDNAILCVLVEGETEEDVLSNLVKHWDSLECKRPHTQDFRFWRWVSDNWTPGDRFPFPKWSSLYEQIEKGN